MVERKESLIDRMKKNKAVYQKGNLNALNKLNQGYKKQEEKDERFFTLKVGESGVGSAIIKFLPSGGLKFTPDEIPMNILKKCQHYFNGGVSWFINNCPTMIGQKCPVCEDNKAIWSFNENLARLRKRNVAYICNVLVVKNPLEPEYEGKVLLYEFGIELYSKIMERIPKTEDMLGKYTDSGDLLFDPFTLLDAVPNFKLKMKMVDAIIGGKKKKKRDFGESSFLEEASQLSDEQIEKVYAKCTNLQELYTWDQYKIKSYDELSAEFKNSSKVSGNVDTEVKKIKDEIDAQKKKNETVETKEEPVSTPSKEEDFDLDGFDDNNLEKKEEPPKKQKKEKKQEEEPKVEELVDDTVSGVGTDDLDELFG